MVTLDADEPVVVDIGARAHVTMSPKRMREMGVSAGAWTTVRCYATPRDDSGVHRRMGASRGRVKGSRTRVEDSKAIERVMRVRREAEEARRAGRAVAWKTLARTNTELDVDDGDEEEDEEEVKTA